MNQSQHVIDFPLGELSPRMLGRYDLEAYQKGAKEITNLWPEFPGGFSQRAGSKHHRTTNGGRFIPWVITPTLAYILELKATKLYIYKNDGTAVMNGGSPLEFTTPWDAAACLLVQRCYGAKAVYLASDQAAIYELSFIATDSFSFGVIPSMSLAADPAFSGSGEYPAALGMHDGRLYAGAPVNDPDLIMASYAGNKPALTFKGTTTSGSNQITNVSAVDIARLRVGETLTSAAFANSTITALGDFSITISNNASASNASVDITRPKQVGLYNWNWYETIVSVSKQQRDPARSFDADMTSGNTTLSNIARSSIYDADTDTGMKVGDRVSGPGIVDKDKLTFVGTATSGSNVITYVSSSVIAKLTIGETITGSHIPSSQITNLGANSVTISNNATGTSDEATFERDEVRTKIATLGETSLVLDRAPTQTGRKNLFAGWADPSVPEYDIVRTESQVVLSATAFKKRLTGDESCRILWFCSGQNLVVGTLGGERIIAPGTTSQNFACIKQTAFGSAPVQPVILGETLFFVSADRKNIREYYYQDANQAYHSPNLNIFSDHILEDGVQDLDFAQAPFPVLFARTGAKEIIGCAYERAYNYAAWFRVTLQDATIESFCVVPDTSGTDTLFCNVKRGSTYHLESIRPPVYGDPHVDGFAQATKTAGQVTGITWLDGAAVVIYNGAEYAVTLAGGAATLPAAIPDGASVYIGSAMAWAFEFMPIQAQTYQGGTAALRTKNITGVIFRLASTWPFYAAMAGHTAIPVPATGAAIEDVRSPIVGRWATMPSLRLTNKSALGFTIRAAEITVDAGG